MSPPAQNLDLSGLPTPVADELRKLVATLRDNLPNQSDRRPISASEPPEQWAARLRAWVDSHPARPVTVDDGREGLYAGRGE